MRNAYVVTGTLTDSQTVRLDEALTLDTTKVRLVVEPILQETPESYQSVMADIRQKQQARGHRSPSAEEVDEYLRAERDSWE